MTSSVTAVLFGIVAMIKDEVYWTEDFLLYAQYITEQHEKEIHSSTTAAGLGAAAPCGTPEEPVQMVSTGEIIEENENA